MKLAELPVNPLTPTVQKLKDALDKAPEGEVYDRVEVEQKFRVSAWACGEAFRRLPEYRAEWRNNKTYWGNPKAIAALLKRKEAK